MEPFLVVSVAQIVFSVDVLHTEINSAHLKGSRGKFYFPSLFLDASLSPRP